MLQNHQCDMSLELAIACFILRCFPACPFDRSSSDNLLLLSGDGHSLIEIQMATAKLGSFNLSKVKNTKKTVKTLKIICLPEGEL